MKIPNATNAPKAPLVSALPMEVVAVVRIRVATRGLEIDTSAQLTEVEKDANIQLVQNRLWEAQAFAQVTAEAGDAQWKDVTNLLNHQLSSV